MVSESDTHKEDLPANDNPEESSPGKAHILDEVLEEVDVVAPRHNRHPLIIDLVMALCLLLTMGAFSAGLIKMYVAHSAEQSINSRNYQAAIALLEGAPFPDLFSPPGSEPKELLNQALYLDAMAKLNAYSEDSLALKELEKIDASSRFFELAQEILKEHFKPSAVQVQGAPAETQAVEPTQTETTQTEPKSTESAATKNSPAGSATSTKETSSENSSAGANSTQSASEPNGSAH